MRKDQCLCRAYCDPERSTPAVSCQGGLLVPSVIVPDESHPVLNPAHPGFAAISGATVERALWFDRRLKE